MLSTKSAKPYPRLPDLSGRKSRNSEILFTVQSDDLKHFGLDAGDQVKVRRCDDWDAVQDRQLCLVRHYLGREFLAAVERVSKEYVQPGDKPERYIRLYSGFFNYPTMYGKTALTLIGIVEEAQCDGLDSLVGAVTKILNSQTAPADIVGCLQVGLNDIYNWLRNQSPVDRFDEDEASPEYVRALLEQHFAEQGGKRL